MVGRILTTIRSTKCFILVIVELEMNLIGLNGGIGQNVPQTTVLELAAEPENVMAVMSGTLDATIQL